MKRNYYRLYIGGNKETAHSYKDVVRLTEVTVWLWAYAKSIKQPEVVWWLAGHDGWESNKDLFDMEVPENIKDEVVKAVRLLDNDPLSFEEYRERFCCPYCQAEEAMLEKRYMELVHDCIYQTVQCHGCDAYYEDVYQLDRYTEKYDE